MEISDTELVNKIKSIFSFFLPPKEEIKDSDIEKIISALKMASDQEYRGMVVEPEYFNNIDELNQNRLYLLIFHGAFSNLIPTEFEVIRLFSLSMEEATALLKSMRYKYSEELEKFYMDTVYKVLHAEDNCSKQGNGYHINIRSADLLAKMNEILAFMERGKLAPIEKVPRSGNLYWLSFESYQKLDEWSQQGG